MKILETILKIIITKQVYTPIIAIFLGIIACKGINSALQKMLKLNDGKNSYEQKKKRTIIDLCSNIFKYVIIKKFLKISIKSITYLCECSKSRYFCFSTTIICKNRKNNQEIFRKNIANKKRYLYNGDCKKAYA